MIPIVVMRRANGSWHAWFRADRDKQVTRIKMEFLRTSGLPAVITHIYL